MRHTLTLVGLVGAIMITPTSASADPAAPTNYRSHVSSAPAGITAEVVGGDAFLRVRAEPGHEVTILGYGDEPWLRIDGAGTVERNRRSPATYLNEDRFAEVEPPPDADPSAAPVWEAVGTGGEWTWHEHRIHWMSADPPPAVLAGDDEKVTVFTWFVPVVVDGQEDAVWGALAWEPDESGALWFTTGVVGAVPLVLAGRRSRFGRNGGILAGGVVALAISVGAWVSQPGGAVGGVPTGVLLGAIVFATGTVSLLGYHKRPRLSDHLALAALAGLVPWVLVHLETFSKPVLPTTLPVDLVRVLTAGVAWIAATGIALAVHSFFEATPAASPSDVAD